MKNRVGPPLVPVLLVAASVAAGQRPALTPRDSAFHALNRLAYGPRPGEVERVAREGVMRWIDRQLAPEQIADGDRAAREREFRVLHYERGDLAQLYLDAQRERRERKADTTADQTPGPVEQQGRRLAGQLAELAVVRATISERQLYEVMVDFWTNHFNVFLGKGADRFLLPDYVEHVIRPHALGRFEDLLIATAESPAMLFYLDNWESVALGLNENYARELLELHTLGVDGGYTQQDVINVARIFTGWSIKRPRQGGDFEFHEWTHDEGEKQVLGVRFQASHGMDEGIRLLKLLANQPATMHHVSQQLCERFVSDDPPDGCVDDAVAAWRRSGGDLRQVLRAIFTSPDFWAPRTLGGKIKTPLEFVVSPARRRRRSRHQPPARAAGGAAGRAAIPPRGAGRVPGEAGRLGEQRGPARPHERGGRARRRQRPRPGRASRLDRFTDRGRRPAGRRPRRTDSRWHPVAEHAQGAARAARGRGRSVAGAGTGRRIGDRRAGVSEAVVRRLG